MKATSKPETIIIGAIVENLVLNEHKDGYYKTIALLIDKSRTKDYFVLSYNDIYKKTKFLP